MIKKINVLSTKSGSKGISSKNEQTTLFPTMESDVDDLGMGVLNDGTPYLNQRGLALICGVQNAHIGTISSQWNDEPEKPRIAAIKTIYSSDGKFIPDCPHVQVSHVGRTHFCYPADICLAILEYYAFDAGTNCQPEARANFRLLAGSKLKDLIYSNVGYDPTGKNTEALKDWHDRISLNHQSAPSGYFSIFNEANPLIYEMITSGVEVGSKLVVDISIGQCWARYWKDNNLHLKYGEAGKFPHRYPDSHPQARSNPQVAWCYPMEALGHYRKWLDDTYVSGGSFEKYIGNKRKSGQIPPSIAQLAIEKIVKKEIGNK